VPHRDSTGLCIMHPGESQLLSMRHDGSHLLHQDWFVRLARWRCSYDQFGNPVIHKHPQRGAASVCTTPPSSRLYPLQDVQLLMHTSTPTLIDLEISDFWLHVCTMWLMRLFPSSSAIPSSWRSFLVSTVSSHTLLFSISTVDDDFDELAPMVIIDDAIFFVSGREVSQPNSTDQPSPPFMRRLQKPQHLYNKRPSPRSSTRPTRAWEERAVVLLVCLR